MWSNCPYGAHSLVGMGLCPNRGGLSRESPLERFHGMEEVRGSIPLSSTKNPQVHARGFFTFPASVCKGFRLPRARSD